MSHRYTPVEIMPAKGQIETSSCIWSAGSCFSDHLGARLQLSLFDTLANPFGILYNPYSIGKSVAVSLGIEDFEADDFSQRGEVHFHYGCHSQLSALTNDELLSNITEAVKNSRKQLSVASHVVITLGTSIVHEQKSNGRIVANCHKMPSTDFTKRMLEIDESYLFLARQLEQLSDKQIILTVSPVRHTREGMMQNQRSKARLIEVVHRLVDSFDHVSYFPAYEIILDELRDYRYFTEDLIHPTSEAVDIVWKKFQQIHMSESARRKVEDVGHLRRAMEHRPVHPQSLEHQKFLDAVERQKQQLIAKYPEIQI